MHTILFVQRGNPVGIRNNARCCVPVYSRYYLSHCKREGVSEKASQKTCQMKLIQLNLGDKVELLTFVISLFMKIYVAGIGPGSYEDECWLIR